MSGIVISFVTSAAICLLIALAFAITYWLTKRRYLLAWSAGFLFGGVNWLVAVERFYQSMTAPGPIVIAILANMWSITFTTIGFTAFRRRSRTAPAVIAAALLASMLVVGAAIAGIHPQAMAWIASASYAGMLVVCARHAHFLPLTIGAQRIVGTLLAVCAGLAGVIAAMAFLVGTALLPAITTLYRAALLVGTPLLMVTLAALMAFVAGFDLLRQSRQDTLVDELTGILNRRGLHDAIAGIWGTRRDAAPANVVVAVADIDHFKSINDRFGHHVGDEVIRGFADIAREVYGAGAVLARVGGEEFVMLLRDTDEATGVALADRLRLATRQAVIAPLPVTISIGVVAARSDEHDFTTLFALADAALYQSKEAGRDRTTCHRPDMPRRSAPTVAAGRDLLFATPSLP